MTEFETALHERIVNDVTGIFDRNSKEHPIDAFTDGARWAEEAFKAKWQASAWDEDREGLIVNKERLTVSLTREQASAVEDALAYYEAVSANNFDMGYTGDEGREERQAHRRVSAFRERLTRRLGEGQ